MRIPLSFVGAGKPVVASNRFRSRMRRARARSCAPAGVPELRDPPDVPTPSPLNLHPDDLPKPPPRGLSFHQKKKGRTRCPQTIPIAGDES